MRSQTGSRAEALLANKALCTGHQQLGGAEEALSLALWGTMSRAGGGHEGPGGPSYKSWCFIKPVRGTHGDQTVSAEPLS